MKALTRIHFIIFALFLGLISSALGDSSENSLGRLKVTYCSYDPNKPFQKHIQKSRSGQVFAVGKNQLLCLASQVRDSQLIQIQPFFQSKLITAKVEQVDYDLNLCLLSVDKKDLQRKFKPVEFTSHFKVGDGVELVWMTHDRRILRTRGRIENPQISLNKYNQTSILKYEISSESSPGGFSEPIFKKNKVAGIVSNFDRDSNISTMIPAHHIENFLKKAKSSSYQSIPKIGFHLSSLKNDVTREYYQIPQDEKRGVLVRKVFDFGTGSKELKPEDIILRWGNYDLSPEGSIQHPRLGRVKFWFLVSEKGVGDLVEVLVLREGKLEKLKIEHSTFSPEELYIPFHRYDYRPLYTLQRGYLFQELTYDYLRSDGPDWRYYVNPLLLEFYEKERLKKKPDEERPVLLSYVLRHPSNQGYQHLQNRLVDSINGTKVKNLKHAHELLNPKELPSFIVVKLKGISPEVVIETQNLEADNLAIQKNYGINIPFYLGD